MLTRCIPEPNLGPSGSCMVEVLACCIGDSDGEMPPSTSMGQVVLRISAGDDIVWLQILRADVWFDGV